MYVCTVHSTELSRLATFAPFLFVRNTPATMIVRRKWNADSLVSQPGSSFRRSSSFQMRPRNKRLARRNGSKDAFFFLLSRRIREVFSVLIYFKVERSFLFSELFELESMIWDNTRFCKIVWYDRESRYWLDKQNLADLLLFENFDIFLTIEKLKDRSFNL